MPLQPHNNNTVTDSTVAHGSVCPVLVELFHNGSVKHGGGKTRWEQWAYMWGTPTKQETSDILGKISFWYHCKEHVFGFHLIQKSSSYSYFLRYDHLCIRLWCFFFFFFEVWFWENRPLKYPIPIVLDMTGCKQCKIFCRKMFENQSEITWRW